MKFTERYEKLYRETELQIRRLDDAKRQVEIETAKLGKKLLELRDEAPHGKYVATIKSLGLSHSRAKRLVQYKQVKNKRFAEAFSRL